MIISKIGGGLGNQLFTYSAGRRLAHKLNTEFKIDITEYENSTKRSYVLNMFNVQENIATLKEIQSLKELHAGTGLGIERRAWIFSPEVLDLPDNVYLSGSWEDERYFADISDLLRREFTLKISLSTSAQYWKEKILSTECSVSLHFRHGDFGYNPIVAIQPSNFILPLNYYYECINKLKQEYSPIKLFIFSNNLQWCKENLRADVPTEFVEGEGLRDFEELHLMSLCKHNIIANSTFSWWAAWLNQNSDKKVFMPIPNQNISHAIYRYSATADENSPLDSDRWIRIPFDISSQPSITMRPYFSILLVVNNDIQTLGESINSILGQDYKFFEVIIIDNASTDGSGKICRQVSKNFDNVTLIKLHNKIQNGAAWNIALKVAQGYYVSFLKSNEKFSADALSKLYLVNENVLADIINAVAWVREPENDDSAVPDGGFILEHESLLKGELRGVFREKLDKLSLLKLLSSNSHATPIGTRLFKRKFLAENKIRFNEKIGEDSELLFVAEAMFQTAEIIFVSNIFYIAPKS